jgi:tetratricopeptide (TPR) repeat protein
MDRLHELKSAALAFRDRQDMESAHQAIVQAATLAPHDPAIAFVHAQIALETGRPAADLFFHALKLDPQNMQLCRNYAAALAADGQADDAIKYLGARLQQNPDWLEGHRFITGLRRTSGAAGDAAQSYAAACSTLPQNLALRLAWFHWCATSHQWDSARAILAEGERLLGQRPAFTLAHLFIASESGASAHDPHLFDAVAHVQDTGLDLCRVRHWLRLGDPARAEYFAARHLGTSSQFAFWPYMSLIWRLQNNPRAAWLDNPASFIRTYDLELPLPELATCLARLHTQVEPFPDQSVRGGTQTDGHLFLRHEPVIQTVRQKVHAAVKDYIQTLAPSDPEHPLLSAARSLVQFEGSWSVRLAGQGFHASHTHPRGWISSALYVSVPEPAQAGLAPAGWITFGTPPPELGLDLPAYATIEPKPGRLVLFPSTQWHGTLPFADGERLTVAFDVRRNADN